MTARPDTTLVAHPDATVTPRGWLTLADAADALGLSIHSVRRKARAGQLVARQILTDRGPAWRVLLHPDGQGDHPDHHPGVTVAATVTIDAPSSGGQGDATVTAHPDATVTGQGDTLTTADLVTLLREREARIDALTVQLITTAEAATVWQERAGTLADRLAVAESKLLALAAPATPLEASTSPSPVGEAPKPFWSRWRTSVPWVLLVVILLLAVAQPAWVR